jgi:basic membrane lipoprotein Med (substrate-binding protein (PBP1-ABC) superfamily)
VLICVAVIATACGSDSTSKGSTSSSAGSGSTAAKNGKDFTIGNAIGGPRNDQAYFQSVYEGAQTAAKTYGVKLSVADSLEADQAAAADAIRNLATGNKLVVADITIASSVLPVAAQMNDTTFIVPSGFYKPGEASANVYGYVTIYGYPTYPMGQIAAKLTKSKKLGYVTGPVFPIERTALEGFKRGAQSIDPTIQVIETVIGGYSDVPGAKQAASAQIASGADVLYGFVDAGFVGIQQAAQESGKDIKLFSPVVDRCDRGDNIVGNNRSDISRMVELAVKDYVDGTLPTPTKAYNLDVPEVQRFELCPKWKKPELVQQADDTVAKIKSGELKLPKEVTAGT